MTKVVSFRVLGATAAIVWLGACAASTPPPSDFRTDATVKDIMDSMIDPSADALWNSVATISTQAGVEERQPRTDEEWAEVRRKAITLVESTNLLVMERKVGEPGEKASGADLTPEQIEMRIQQDRRAWIDMAHGLHDAVQPALQAIAKRDPEGLLSAGEAIDTACENCHRKYWYPDAPTGP